MNGFLLLQWTSVKNTNQQLAQISWNGLQCQIFILFCSFNTMYFADMAFTGGSVGTQLRGNLPEPAINPEDIHLWSYLCCYWLRWWAKCCEGVKKEERWVLERVVLFSRDRRAVWVCLHATCMLFYRKCNMWRPPSLAVVYLQTPNQEKCIRPSLTDRDSVGSLWLFWIIVPGMVSQGYPVTRANTWCTIFYI